MLTTAVVLAVAAGNISSARTVRALPDTAAPVRIVALGDSLTSGHRLPAGDAYPAVLTAALKNEGIAAVVINHGVSGDTTSGGLRRLPAALAAGAPRVVEDEKGTQSWVFEGKHYPNVGLNAVVGRPRAEWSMEPARFDAAGHGRRVVADGAITSERPGRPLRGPGFR